MDPQDTAKKDIPSILMKYGMMACCAVMLLPVVGFLVAGGSIAGLLQNSALLVPIVLCVGAHLVMHRFMGRSCHGDHASKSEHQDEETATEPKTRDQPTG